MTMMTIITITVTIITIIMPNSKSDAANLPIFSRAMITFQQCFCLQYTCVMLQEEEVLR